MAHNLEWQDGTRSAADGTDLASVARGLALAELVFWIERITMHHEGNLLRAELARRCPDGEAGPLFRHEESHG